MTDPFQPIPTYAEVVGFFATALNEFHKQDCKIDVPFIFKGLPIPRNRLFDAWLEKQDHLEVWVVNELRGGISTYTGIDKGLYLYKVKPTGYKNRCKDFFNKHYLPKKMVELENTWLNLKLRTQNN